MTFLDSKNPLKNRYSLAGFSLIEILLVVILLCVIAAISIPNFSSSYRTILLKKQAEDISYLMRYAQSRAINKGVYMVLSFYDDQRYYRIMESEGDIEADPRDMEFKPFNGRLARPRKVPQGIIIDTDIDDIYFYPNGEIDRVSFDICGSKKCYEITTEIQRGQVKLLDPEDNV